MVSRGDTIETTTGDQNAEVMAALIEKEIESKPEGRYFHRLHIVLLLARGMSCKEVAKLFGEPLRSVQRWGEKVNQGGLEALKPG